MPSTAACHMVGQCSPALDHRHRLQQGSKYHLQPVLHLLLVLGVGVRVVDDNRVGGLEVEAAPRRPNGQQKYEALTVWCVELLDRRLPADVESFIKPILKANTRWSRLTAHHVTSKHHVA